MTRGLLSFCVNNLYTTKRYKLTFFFRPRLPGILAMLLRLNILVCSLFLLLVNNNRIRYL